jgi:hypothetical protein
VTRLPCGLGLNSAVTIPLFPYDSTGSLHESIHATLGDMMAKAVWECDTKKRMGLLHEIPLTQRHQPLKSDGSITGHIWGGAQPH